MHGFVMALQLFLHDAFPVPVQHSQTHCNGIDLVLILNLDLVQVVAQFTCTFGLILDSSSRFISITKSSVTNPTQQRKIDLR